jgi:hypothetical protein
MLAFYIASADGHKWRPLRSYHLILMAPGVRPRLLFASSEPVTRQGIKDSQSGPDFDTITAGNWFLFVGHVRIMYANFHS